MKRIIFTVVGVGLIGVVGIGMAARSRPTAPAPVSAPPTITVSYPVERSVTNYADFTGRTAAVDSVEVRARVSGYLQKVYFKEGELVKKDQVLFEIDPSMYQAQYEAAVARHAQSQASLRLAETNNRRFQELFKSNSGAVSKVDLDKYASQEAEQYANVQAAKANVDSAKLNLNWTKVTSPISGRISRYYVTEGNFVQSGDQGGTVLTTLVSVDPIYAYFDIDESTVLRIDQLTREGKAVSTRDGTVPVMLKLANEKEFSRQ